MISCEVGLRKINDIHSGDQQDAWWSSKIFGKLLKVLEIIERA